MFLRYFSLVLTLIALLEMPEASCPYKSLFFKKFIKKIYIRVDKGKGSNYFKKDKGLHKITNIMNQI